MLGKLNIMRLWQIWLHLKWHFEICQRQRYPSFDEWNNKHRIKGCNRKYCDRVIITVLCTLARSLSPAFNYTQTHTHSHGNWLPVKFVALAEHLRHFRDFAHTIKNSRAYSIQTQLLVRIINAFAISILASTNVEMRPCRPPDTNMPRNTYFQL